MLLPVTNNVLGNVTFKCNHYFAYHNRDLPQKCHIKAQKHSDNTLFTVR